MLHDELGETDDYAASIAALRAELERLQDVVGEEDFDIIQKVLARQK